MSQRAAFLLGAQDAWPTFFAVVSFGLITGISTKGVGIPNLEAIVMSIFMFAGTAQLAGLQVFASGGSFILIVLTAVIVNLRYVMYSALLAPHLKHLSFKWKSLLSFLMVDQIFAFGINRFQLQPDMVYKEWYYLGIGLPLFILWSFSCATGVLVGAQIPSGWSLDFSLPLVFLGLLASSIKDRSSALTALASVVVALLALGLPYKLGLIIAALVGTLVGVVSQRYRWFQHD